MTINQNVIRGFNDELEKLGYDPYGGSYGTYNESPMGKMESSGGGGGMGAGTLALGAAGIGGAAYGAKKLGLIGGAAKKVSKLGRYGKIAGGVLAGAGALAGIIGRKRLAQTAKTFAPKIGAQLSRHAPRIARGVQTFGKQLGVSAGMRRRVIGGIGTAARAFA